VSLSTAAFSLTIAGGGFGDSVATGAIVSAASSFAMWVNTGSSTSTGGFVSTAGFVIDVPLWLGSQSLILTGLGSGELRGPDKTLSLWDVGRLIYALWGYEVTDLRAISIGRERLVALCNAAMQLIFSRADTLDYFNRQQLTISVSTSGTVALDSSIQKIQGPARIGTSTLRTLASRSEYDSFAALVLGDSTLAAPIAFYVEPTRAALGDSVALSLNLIPLPTDTVSVVLDVSMEPPRYDVVDMMQGTVLQLPHKWAETLFIPLVRKWACADSLMPTSRRTAMMGEINEHYATAQRLLGLADIEVPAQSAAKPKEGQKA
jgi:hypothetical protein